MKKVILTVGPRAAGKTTFCKGVIALHPEIVFVSRDEIFEHMFGSAAISQYDVGGAMGVMWSRVEEALTSKNVTVILDTWNGTDGERIALCERLRQSGADMVIAWHFITSVETVEEWFWKKPGIARTSERQNRSGKDVVLYADYVPCRVFEMFQRLLHLPSCRFDEVVRINPLQIKPEDVAL